MSLYSAQQGKCAISGEEVKKLIPILNDTVDACLYAIENDIDKSMNKYNVK